MARKLIAILVVLWLTVFSCMPVYAAESPSPSPVVGMTFWDYMKYYLGLGQLKDNIDFWNGIFSADDPETAYQSAVAELPSTVIGTGGIYFPLYCRFGGTPNGSSSYPVSTEMTEGFVFSFILSTATSITQYYQFDSGVQYQGIMIPFDYTGYYVFDVKSSNISFNFSSLTSPISASAGLLPWINVSGDSAAGRTYTFSGSAYFVASPSTWFCF